MDLQANDEISEWRVKIDVRCGIDVPPSNVSTVTGLPSTFVECGWSIYDQRQPDQNQLKLSKIINEDRNPIFNEQFIINGPTTLHGRDGYIYMCLQNKDSFEPILTTYIPLVPMTPFQPYHFQLESGKRQEDPKGILIFSIIVEEIHAESFLDTYLNIMIYDLPIEPMPFRVSSIYLIMTSDGLTPNSIPYIKHNIHSVRNISQSIIEYVMQGDKIWVSPIMRIPPMKQTSQNTITQFTILKSHLSRNLSFFIMARNEAQPEIHPLPNCIIGYSEIVDQNLKSLYYADAKSRGFIQLLLDQKSGLYNAFKECNIKIELNVNRSDFAEETEPANVLQEKDENVGLIDLRNEMGLRFKENGSELQEENIDQYANLLSENIDAIKLIEDEGKKWEKIEKEITQKQDQTQRLMRELDDKTESLK